MELNYKTFGHGPALIILHGLFGSLDNWITLGRRFSEDFSVFLIDQRNHGKSPHSDDWSYAAMAEDLLEFMDSHGIMQAHLLGHSMGGKTVMEFAGHWPERIDWLVVADMAPKAYPPHHDEIIEALTKIDLKNLEARQDADEELQKHISEPNIRQFLLKGLDRDSKGDFSWKYNLEVIADKYPEILADVEMIQPFFGPTVFVYGGDSYYLQESDKSMIRERFPEAIFREIPGAGHWLHAEKPDEFYTIIHNFLCS